VILGAPVENVSAKSQCVSNKNQQNIKWAWSQKNKTKQKPLH